MRGVQKDKFKELSMLKDRLRHMLRENGGELSGTSGLLRERERQIMARLAALDSMETMREEISKPLRKDISEGARSVNQARV